MERRRWPSATPPRNVALLVEPSSAGGAAARLEHRCGRVAPAQVDAGLRAGDQEPLVVRAPVPEHLAHAGQFAPREGSGPYDAEDAAHGLGFTAWRMRYR